MLTAKQPAPRLISDQPGKVDDCWKAQEPESKANALSGMAWLNAFNGFFRV